MPFAAEGSYLAAFAVAFLGGVHCVGMCGGIVGALTLGIAPGEKKSFRVVLPYLLAYNLGRISSYTLAGALVGGVAAMAGEHRIPSLLKEVDRVARHGKP